MKNLNESHSNAGQSTTVVKKSQKHDTNLQKNSTLYFQVGLILCLLGTFALFEMQFKHVVFKIDDTAMVDDNLVEVSITDYKIYQEPIKQEKKVVKQRVITDVFKVTDKPLITEPTETLITEPPTTPEPAAKVEDIVDPEPPVENVHINRVGTLPVFPGCEKYQTKKEQLKCMSKKINKLVQKKFNTDVAVDNGLSGKQKIYVQFKIDKQGNVIDIRTRSPHQALDNEAQRVINKIPKMKPGYQGDKPVNVIYNLPIVFDVRD